jgi:hypothetical protein
MPVDAHPPVLTTRTFPDKPVMPTLRSAIHAGSIVLALAACGDNPATPGPTTPTPKPFGISVSPKVVTLNALGYGAPLTVTLTNATSADSAALRLRSLDLQVVTLSAAGYAIANGVGTTRVVAESGTKADTVQVTVRQVLAGVRLNAAGDTLFKGDTIQIHGVAVDSGGTPIPGLNVRLDAGTGTAARLLDATGRIAAELPGQATFQASVPGTGVSARVEVTVTEPFVQVVGGALHICALTTTGAAWCWGSNGTGQVGLPATDTIAPRPAYVTGAPALTKLVASGGGSCGLASSGDVYCWGTFGSARLGPGAVRLGGAVRFRDVAANFGKVCGVTADDVLYCWEWTGLQGAPQQVDTPAGARSVFGNTDYVCVAGTAGGVDCLEGAYGGPPVSVPEALVSGSAYGEYRCAQSASGATYCWTRFSSPARLAGSYLPGTIAQAAQHGCVVAANGEARCWGSNNYGALGNGGISYTYSDPVNATPVTGGLTFSAVAAGGYGYEHFHSCGIANGSLYCWGTNQELQLGNGYAREICRPSPANGGPIACSPRPVRVSRVRPGVTGPA